MNAHRLSGLDTNVHVPQRLTAPGFNVDLGTIMSKGHEAALDPFPGGYNKIKAFLRRVGRFAEKRDDVAAQLSLKAMNLKRQVGLPPCKAG